MKQINKYIWGHLKNPNFSIVERLHINKDTGNHDHYYNYHPKDKHELKELVKKLIKERGDDADLNDIDTSEITDMSFMFENSKFNGDITNWDVSNVKNMSYMLANSEFNNDISHWNVSNVIKMRGMFYNSPLEKNPPKWYK